MRNYTYLQHSVLTNEPPFSVLHCEFFITIITPIAAYFYLIDFWAWATDWIRSEHCKVNALLFFHIDFTNHWFFLLSIFFLFLFSQFCSAKNLITISLDNRIKLWCFMHVNKFIMTCENVGFNAFRKEMSVVQICMSGAFSLGKV
jgi:hypothetical protein